jgi:hypothetical protein
MCIVVVGARRHYFRYIGCNLVLTIIAQTNALLRCRTLNLFFESRWYFSSECHVAAMPSINKPQGVRQYATLQTERPNAVVPSWCTHLYDPYAPRPSAFDLRPKMADLDIFLNRLMHDPLHILVASNSSSIGWSQLEHINRLPLISS